MRTRESVGMLTNVQAARAVAFLDNWYNGDADIAELTEWSKIFPWSGTAYRATAEHNVWFGQGTSWSKTKSGVVTFKRACKEAHCKLTRLYEGKITSGLDLSSLAKKVLPNAYDVGYARSGSRNSGELVESELQQIADAKEVVAVEPAQNVHLVQYLR